MKDQNWIQTMQKLEMIRLFSSLYIKKTRKGELTSMQQVDALFRIGVKGGITPLDLSKGMGTSKTIISRLIEQLTAKKMITKRYDRSDQRSYSLYITKTGKQELDGMYRYYLEPVYELEEQMEKEELMQLYFLIDKANKILTKKEEVI